MNDHLPYSDMNPDSGWYINKTMLTKLYEGNPVPTDAKKLEKKLLDIDIREYGDPTLSSCSTKEALSGPVVLQLTKYRNVSRPKTKDDQQSGSDVIRLSLTDGHSSISALLLETVKGLSADTPPGTKLLLLGTAAIQSGFVMLTSCNVVVIGGHVDHLIEKWTLERHSFQDSQRILRSDHSAPKWLSFGKRSATHVDQSTRGFKANDALAFSAKKDPEDSNAFDLQRRENIEAIGQGNIKVFSAPKIQQLPTSALTFTEGTETRNVVERGHDRREKKSRRRVLLELYNDRKDRKQSDRIAKKVPAEFARPSKPSTLFDFVNSNVALDPNPTDCLNSNSSTVNPSYNTISAGQIAVQQCRAYSGNAVLEDDVRQRADRKKPFAKFDGRKVAQGSRKKLQQSAQSHRYPQRPESGVQYAPDIQSQVMQKTRSRPTSSKANNQAAVPAHRNIKSECRWDAAQDRVNPQFLQDFSSLRFGNEIQPTSHNEAGLNLKRNYSLTSTMPRWKVGDICKAPWNDGMYYLATVVSLGPADMCAVRYQNYGSIGTVPQAVLLNI